MATDSTPRAPRRRAPGFLLLWLLGTSAAALSVARPQWPAGAAPRTDASPPAQTEWPLDTPGIVQPAALPAAAAALAPDEAVIGVSAGGRDRAYLVRALAKDPMSHIVNDVLGGVPVSVTHCNVFHCTRLFTGATSGGPLDISQGGLKSSGMVLRSGGRLYRQDSAAPLEAGAPPFPYDPYPGKETTWAAWRLGHPDTDVYVADVDISPPAGEPSSADRAPGPRQALVVSRIPGLLASFVYFGAAPLLIVLATLMAHVLFAFLLGPRGRRGARATLRDGPGAAGP